MMTEKKEKDPSVQKRVESNWLALVDRILGPNFGDEPTSIECVETCSKPSAIFNEEIAKVFAEHQALHNIIEEGLKEMSVSLAYKPPAGGAILSLADLCDPAACTFYGFLQFEHPRLHASAASWTDRAPIPEDRQVLVEEKKCFRLVYYRQGAQAVLAFFAEQAKKVHLTSCTLNEAPIDGDPYDDKIITFQLGPVFSLAGKKLAISMAVENRAYQLTWTLVPR